MGKLPMNTANNFETQSPKANKENTSSDDAINIILNHDFSEGLHFWHPNSCNASVVPAGSADHKENGEDVGLSYAIVTNRKECWQGLEQDITSRISTGCIYTVSVCVGLSGTFQGSTEVQATLRLVHQNSETAHLLISKKSVTKEGWQMLDGSFSLSTIPNQVFFYLEGPSPGSDLLIKSVEVTCPSSTDCKSSLPASSCANDEKIVVNSDFDERLKNWSGKGCKVVLHDSMAPTNIKPASGKYYASATDRSYSWNGIQQDITGRVKGKLVYEMTAVVRLCGDSVDCAEVWGVLWVQGANNCEYYTLVAKVEATDKDWVQLQGKFILNDASAKVVISLEGAPPGTDILLNSLVLNPAAKPPPPPSPPFFENAPFGVNIITNAHLNECTDGWFLLGNCAMSVQSGSPRIIPPMARDSLGDRESLSGRYILVTNRTEFWMGPAQMITDKVKLYLTYQVSAWVKAGQASGPQNVCVTLDVDGQWVSGGQVEVSSDEWHEIGGFFRIEKQAAKVRMLVEGPAAGVDLMVAGLQVFPVDRSARFNHLKRKTEKIRKRDVILKFSGLDTGSGLGTSVRVEQKQNSFPFGSCICKANLDNEDFKNFFVKNFNWAVFENELKWYYTEPLQGKFNYKDADELLNFCKKNDIQVRGHAIFWEVESKIQSWIRSLNKNDLMTAVQNQLSGLLTRYKGEFKHYDVNNEMLHGSFFKDRLGKEIWSHMFKQTHQLDPSAILFVNDYHVEDGCDARSSPEKYIDLIRDLQEQGAPVGGIGLQGHIDNPVGPGICSALDKLSIFGLPIWFTEVDVSSTNEHIRADDLEVILREAFAHPAVEGIILWGFWELFMSKENSHLVNAEGDINEAGKRYLALKQEWLSHSDGHTDDQGQFSFRGFHGSYEVEVVTGSKKVTKTFVVDKGNDSLVISIDG